MHTILFNIAAFTILKLTKEQAESVWNIIEDTMNGDNLYEGANRETILEAYYHQENIHGETWVELIKDTLAFA